MQIASDETPGSPDAEGPTRDPPGKPAEILAILAAGCLALHGVLKNGFLILSDDGAFVLANPLLAEPLAVGLLHSLSRFHALDYVPLPLASFLLEHKVFGFQAVGYHLDNLLLHLLNAVLVWQVARHALRSPRAALFAGLVFVVHPVQVEAVSVIAQRKTLLATGFLLASLRAHQEFRGGKRRGRALSVALYCAACASKSSVVPFPLLVALYERTFRPGSRAWRVALPFLFPALVTVLLGIASKMGTGVIKSPQGGSYLTTALVMSRVAWEYLLALLLPFDLAPAYYYARDSVAGASTAFAAATLLASLVFLTRRRRQLPLTFFFVAWCAVSLLPVANLVPIAVVRADRYLYLPMVGFSLWAGAGLAAIGDRGRTSRAFPRRVSMGLPVAAIAVLIALTLRHVPVYRTDTTAWERAVNRHPWSAAAHYMLAEAFRQNGETGPALQWAERSLRIDPTYAAARELQFELTDGRRGSPPAHAVE